MSKVELSVMKEITDLRMVWPNAATDFTPWLAEDENIAKLGEAIGLDITVTETESAVGSFLSDILAKETGTDHKIIIENQLGDTDHDHLGKIITYASGKDAKIIIWIVKHAREEHKAAIEWLNAHTEDGIGFFLCELKLFQIDDSRLAPMFFVIEMPNDWAKEQKKISNGEMTENQQVRTAYWSAWNDYAWKNNVFAKNFRKRKASSDHWYTLSIGTSDAHINLLRLKVRDAIGVELNIPDNKALYDKLEVHKDEINAETGLELDWRRLDDKKACRILIEKEFNIDDKEDWPSEFSWLMDTALKMKKAFKKYI